jgi:hypothetical protein
MKTYGKLLAGLVAVWFVFALSAAVLGVFKNQSNQIGAAVGLAAAIPILLFGLWYAASEGFRRYVLTLDPEMLTMAQATRMAGLMFIVLAAYQILPSGFAYLAGYGDILVGATAFLAARKLALPRRRSGFIWWQLLGITDLVTAVGTGSTWQLLHSGGPSMLAMTVLPMSLVPTFLVPLFFIFHLISIAQARRWSETAAPENGSVRPVFAR